MLCDPNLIIIADDDSDDALFLLTVLLSMPLELTVITVPNGERLIKILEVVSPHFIFLDINMPSMTGWEFLEHFDKLDDTIKSKFRIFILSSSVDQRDKEKAEGIQYISDYLKKHLQLKIDGKAVSIEYLGFEKEGEAAWCYLQVSNVSSVKKIEITDKILHETFNTQINIIHVTVNGERKSNRLNYPDATVEVSF